MVLAMLGFLRKMWLLPLAALAAQPALAETPTKAPAAQEAKKPPAIVQDYQPRPAIWLVADEDTRIYMLGTVHMLPPGFRWRSPAIDRLVAQADELVVETYDDGKDISMEEAMLLFREDAVPFLERVPEKHRAAVEAMVAESDMPRDALDSMQTWSVAMFLGISALLDSYGAEDADDAPGVEDVLERDFVAAKKPIGSIEDPGAVLRSLNAIPEEDQLALLLTGLEEMGTEADEEELLARDLEDNHDWARGAPEKLADFAADMPASFVGVLLTKRNAAWALWVEERLKRPGTVLLAVGAGHLAGKDSLQDMLEARGLRATRFD